MKKPSCQCGSIQGWLHDIQCNLCGCYPWQHSSDESDYDSSDAESEEHQLELARNEMRLKIQEEKREKIAHIDRAIWSGNYCIKADEERFEMLHRMWENDKQHKKKRFRTRGFRNKIRETTPSFKSKSYELDVYEYYKRKDEYEEDVLLDYFHFLGLDAAKKMKQFRDAELLPSEVKLLDFEEFLAQ